MSLTRLALVYESAVEAQGARRLALFKMMQAESDRLAEDCARPLAYANLGHNFGNALMLALGMQMRLDRGVMKRGEGRPDYTPDECRAELARFEGVLLQNGLDILRLINGIMEPVVQAVAA